MNSQVVTHRQRAMAWGVHLYTASGAIWGLLTLMAIQQEAWRLAFIWMGVALFVDGFDGKLARRTGTSVVVPNFDGALLDNMVDYLNYVITPAFFLLMAGLLPPPAAIFGACVIVLASAYQFCQVDAKTDDHHFKGFPSYWNILVFYLYFLQLDAWWNLTLVLICAALVFIPIKYLYPSRMRRWQRTTIGLAALWGALGLIVLYQYPDHNPSLLYLSLFYPLYYVVLSLYNTVRRHH